MSLQQMATPGKRQPFTRQLPQSLTALVLAQRTVSGEFSVYAAGPKDYLGPRTPLHSLDRANVIIITSSHHPHCMARAWWGVRSPGRSPFCPTWCLARDVHPSSSIEATAAAVFLPGSSCRRWFNSSYTSSLPALQHHSSS